MSRCGYELKMTRLVRRYYMYLVVDSDRLEAKKELTQCSNEAVIYSCDDLKR
jgi:hypothetical protein